jgi:hypothetical protein
MMEEGFDEGRGTRMRREGFERTTSPELVGSKVRIIFLLSPPGVNPYLSS